MSGIIPQLVVNGLILGALLALLALAFSLSYFVREHFNLALLPLWLANGYLLWFGMHAAPTPLGLFGTLIVGAVLSIALGVMLVVGIYLPLHKRGMSDIFVPSLSLLIMGQSLFAIAFGPTPQLFNIGEALGRTDALIVGSIYVEPYQVTFMALALPILAVILVWTKLSKQGRLITALVENRELAAVVGINTRALTIVAYVVGSALLAPAAIVLAGSSGVGPYVGLAEFILAIAAALAAPVGNFVAVVAAAFAIGLLRELSLFWIPGHWQTSFALAVFIVAITLSRRASTSLR